MANDRVVTGAIAIVKVKGVVVAKMKDFRYQETHRRLRVGGIGTIFASEKPVVEFDASLTCDFMAVDMESSGIPGAIKEILTLLEAKLQQVVLLLKTIWC